MSYRWAYIIIVIVIVSYLRYIAYKRSQRVEQKLDLILETLGVSLDEGVTKGSAKLVVSSREEPVDNETPADSLENRQ